MGSSVKYEMRQCICVFLVYKGPKVKFSSVCRAEQMVNIGPIVGDILNFLHRVIGAELFT